MFYFPPFLALPPTPWEIHFGQIVDGFILLVQGVAGLALAVAVTLAAFLVGFRVVKSFVK